MAFSDFDAVIDTLWRPRPEEGPPRIFAILDGAREERIYAAVLESECEYECLYRGELDPDLASAAPYLLALQADLPFTKWLINQGWGESWGIFIESRATLRDLRQHFRRFLMVHDESGKPLYFRFYDPRVLRTYLPNCNAEELAKMFGPVDHYLAEAEEPGSLITYGFRRRQLQERKVALAQALNAAGGR